MSTRICAPTQFCTTSLMSKFLRFVWISVSYSGWVIYRMCLRKRNGAGLCLNSKTIQQFTLARPPYKTCISIETTQETLRHSKDVSLLNSALVPGHPPANIWRSDYSSVSEFSVVTLPQLVEWSYRRHLVVIQGHAPRLESSDRSLGLAKRLMRILISFLILLVVIYGKSDRYVI